MSWLLWLLVGGVILFVADGLFYLWTADDFWFKLHSLQGIRSLDALLSLATYSSLEETARLIWQRGTLLFRSATSGWGVLAVGFWPAALLVLIFDRRGRGIAVWAIATYFLVAFAPVSFKNGLHPYPTFHARHVLTACIPFAPVSYTHLRAHET